MEIIFTNQRLEGYVSSCNGDDITRTGVELCEVRVMGKNEAPINYETWQIKKNIFYFILIDGIVDYLVVYPSSAVVLAKYGMFDMDWYHVLGSRWSLHDNPTCFIWNVYIFSGCDEDRYSSNQCRRFCPEKCRHQNCDAFNGSCIYGCNNPKALTLDCIGKTALWLKKPRKYMCGLRCTISSTK